jgi:hypothetical protein
MHLSGCKKRRNCHCSATRYVANDSEYQQGNMLFCLLKSGANVRILRKDYETKMILRRLARWVSCAVAVATAGLAASAFALPIGYSVRSDGDDNLYKINLATGAATQLGPTGFPKIEGLAISAAGELFGVNPNLVASSSQLVKCSTTTGACAAVGSLGVTSVSGTNAGLTFAANGQLYMALNAAIYWVNPATGITAPLGPTGPALSGLAAGAPSAKCASGLYGLGGNTNQGEFFCVNPANGAVTLLGTLPGAAAVDSGLDGDATTGLVWGITNPSSASAPAQIFSVVPATLEVSKLIDVTLNGAPIGGFESLAVEKSAARPGGVTAGAALEVPGIQPSTLALLIALSLAFGVGALRRQRQSVRR